MDVNQAQEVLHCVQKNHEAQVQFLRRLVEAESPSLEPERLMEIFSLLAAPLQELDFQVRILKGRQSGGQLFARPANRRHGAPLQLLLGHCDTVWPLGKLEEMPLRLDGSHLAGPGVFDMKAGLSQIVFALEALRQCRVETPVTPVVYLTSDEELGSEDSRCRIQLIARRADRVLIPEPPAGSEGRLKTTRKGVGLFEIEVEGRAAHAGVEPEAGVSAVLELSHLVQALHALADPDRGLTVTVGVIAGGTRPNIIPAFARAVVDVRARTLKEMEAVEGIIRTLAPTVPGARVIVKGGLDRPPMEATPGNQALWQRAREVGRLLDLELEDCESGGGSDGNLTSAFAPTLDGLGAIGAGAHAEGEYVDLGHLPERTALLALLIASPPIQNERRQ
ncbi:MAG: M20 family metallopeptidase [Acidobacteriota bacterium]